MLFMAPRLLIGALAVHVLQLAYAIPVGVELLAGGSLALVACMIRERWNRRYVAVPEEVARHGVPEDASALQPRG